MFVYVCHNVWKGETECSICKKHNNVRETFVKLLMYSKVVHGYKNCKRIKVVAIHTLIVKTRAVKFYNY